MICRYEVPTTDVEHSDIVIAPVYLRERKGGSSNYSPTQLFGQPLLLGFPRNNLTYETLYERVLSSLSRYVTPPAEGQEWWKPQAENDKVNGSDAEASKPSLATDPSEDSNSPISEENQSPDSENDPSNTMDFMEEDDMKGPPKLFALNLVNSYGNSQLVELANDGNPIKLKCKCSFIVLGDAWLK